MNEMRKLLNLMESATEEVSEGFFSPKVSHEEFYAKLNDMLDLIIQQGELDDLHSKRITTVVDLVNTQQKTILALTDQAKAMSESLGSIQEVSQKLMDAVVSIQDRITGDDSPPDGNTPPDEKIH